MADEPTGSKAAARTRVIIILGLAGLAVYMYMRYKKQQTAATSQQPAAAAGDTNPDQITVPAVPTYNLSGSYNGPYTPTSIVNNGVTQPAGNMGSGWNGSQAITDALQNGGYVNTVNNTNSAG
jgi:hypothetical protein